MSAESAGSHTLRATYPSNLTDWRRRLDREQIAPVIAVAGSRGKTSVVRIVESIFRQAGYRVATWTNWGVEFAGERQRGELGAWSRALTRLNAGGLDVALQEIDWATAASLNLPDRGYPLVAITNLCANSEACLVSTESLQAQKGLRLMRSSVARTGQLILNADDFAVSDPDPLASAERVLIAISADTPVLRRHLHHGGNAAWISDETIVLREGGRTLPIVAARDLAWAEGGTVPFGLYNALLATAVARSSGLAPQLIADGLASYQPQPHAMPGSFNVFDVLSARVVVDRPVAPWFLRPALRAAMNLGSGHQVRVVGPMMRLATGDLSEVGRLLGRNGGVLLIHGSWGEERLHHLRQGAAINEVPPIVLPTSDERSAILQGLDMLRPHDVMLILAEDPSFAVRLVEMFRRSRSSSFDGAVARP